MRKKLFAVAGLALLASATFASYAGAADHRDSPSNISNPTADINDVYAFRSPTNANNLVVAISANPLIVPADNARRGVFDPAVQFKINVDGNGDLSPDAVVNIRRAGDTLVFEGLGEAIAAQITAPGQAPVINRASPVTAFAGLRDDPFFFDLAGFQAFVANPQAPAAGLRAAGAGSPVDAFAGTNILAIVVELPVTAMTGGANANTGTIKTWVTSHRQNRIDRMAIPAINTALIPTAQKDAFNVADPINDAANFRPAAINTINTLRGAVDKLFAPKLQDGGPLGNLTSEQVGAALIPDVVTIDFSKPVQFPNGRRLQDDVIDAALGVVLNRGGPAGISDGVNANDKAFLGTFPYLAEPHTGGAAAPAPSGGGTISPPRTGDAGLMDANTSWALSAAFLAVAIALAGTGVAVTVRSRGR